MSADATQPTSSNGDAQGTAPTPSTSTLTPADWSESSLRTKNGSISKMRAHKGNVPTLPQTKLCHLCPAKFTRTTHLNRHLKTHSNERLHECERCHAQFTRSDLLTRHKRTCCDSSASRSRRKSCKSCAESKVKCDLQRPCSKCKARGRECVYATSSIPASAGPEPGSSPEAATTSSASNPTPPEASSQNSSSEASPPSGSSPSSGEDSSTAPELSSTTDIFGDLTSLSPFVSSSNILGESSALSARTLPSDDPLLSDGVLVRTHSANPEAYPRVSLTLPTEEQNAAEKAHLTELFSSEMYDNLFSDLFTSSYQKNPLVPGQHFQQDPTAILTDRFEATGISQAMMNAFFDMPTQIAIYNAPSQPADPALDAHDSIPESEVASLAMAITPIKEMPSIGELYEYIHSFLTTYTHHMPIVHLPTFLSQPRLHLLVKATKACGAMYLTTPTAMNFIEHTLSTTRDEIIAELSHTTDYDAITQLTLASCLVQTIGMFHKDPDQRTKSNVYHGMIVMMLRMSGYVDKTRDWKYEEPDFNDPEAVNKAWKEWVRYESAKRAIWVCFLHDCCHAIFFNISPTFHTEQFTLGLPSEDALWTAKDANEWAAVLQTPSPYGGNQVRLSGHYLKSMYFYLVQDNPHNEARQFLVSPFAHFVMIHALMRKLFEMYLRDRLPFHQPTESSSGTLVRLKVLPHFVDKDRVHHLQILLHCWLQSWLQSPETPRDVPESQQRFLFNALPFYWLVQVGLVAYQEGLPPFDAEGVYITSHEAKFQLMKKWEKHIRKFLERGEEAPTMFWDEVMKSRTETWQAESGFEWGHLLGFFTHRE